MSPPIRTLLAPGLVLLALSALSAGAAEPAPTPPPGSDRTPAADILRLPDFKLEAPRRVQAATTALGLGRQRMALVLGQSRVAGVDLPAATRDTRAVAEVLRKSGFVVMHRDDLSAAELRSTLKEFRGRLDPGAAGLIYLAGAGGRLDGQSLVLTRDLSAAAAATAEGLKAASVPLQDVIDALQITPSSLRLMVVDAAPLLAPLPPERRGLAAPRLPEGVMALMSAPPGQTLEPRLPPPLPDPLPSDPRELTGSAFGTAVAHALTGSRVTGPDALRNARRLAIDGTGGAVTPWLGGATDEKDEFAAPDLVETLLPQTPEEAAARAVRKVSGLAGDALRAGGSAAVRAAVPPAGIPGALPGTVPGGLPAGSPPVPGVSGTPGAPTASAAPPTIPPSATLPSPATSAIAPSPAAGTTDATGRSSQPDIGQVAQSVAQQAAAVTGVAATGAAVLGGVQAAKAEAVSAAVSTTVATALPVVTQALGTVATALGVGNSAPGRVDTSLKDAREGVGEVAGDGAAERAGGAASRSAPSGSGSGNAGGSSAPTSSANPAPAAEGPAGPQSSPATAPAAPALPVMNPYGYAPGDSFTYRRVDEWKGEEIGSLVQVIRRVMSDGEMEAQQNGATQALDAQGRTRSRSGPEGRAEFTPVEEFWWSRPKPGESRDVEFTERFQRGDGSGERRWEGEVEVGKLTRIETPAGSFDVLPMEGEGWFHEIRQPGNVRRSVIWERTVWYSPDLGHPVAMDIVERDAGSRLLRKERVELTQALTSRTIPK